MIKVKLICKGNGEKERNEKEGSVNSSERKNRKGEKEKMNNRGELVYTFYN